MSLGYKLTFRVRKKINEINKMNQCNKIEAQNKLVHTKKSYLTVGIDH